jgi:hypothetical protein
VNFWELAFFPFAIDNIGIKTHNNHSSRDEKCLRDAAGKTESPITPFFVDFFFGHARAKIMQLSLLSETAVIK